MLLSLWSLHSLDSFNRYTLYLPTVLSKPGSIGFKLHNWTIVTSHFPIFLSPALSLMANLIFILSLRDSDFDVVHFIGWDRSLQLLSYRPQKCPPVLVTIPSSHIVAVPSVFPFLYVTTPSADLRHFLTSQMGWERHRVRLTPLAKENGEGDLQVYRRTALVWLALYRRSFEEAVADFTGWHRCSED